MAVLSGDPEIVRVEAYVASRYFFHNGDWEARREMEVQSPVVETRPVGEGVYLASIPCEEPPETQTYNSWSRCSTTVVRGYDAAGALVYDSSAEEG